MFSPPWSGSVVCFSPTWLCALRWSRWLMPHSGVRSGVQPCPGFPVGMGSGDSAAGDRLLDDLQRVRRYGRLRQAVANQDPQEGGRQVGQIRKLVGTNLILGLIVVAIGAGGRYL